jgi:hypothetical protein
MQITNEDMEVLNRATEIVSGYSANGIIPPEDFQYFGKIIDTIINETTNKQHEICEDYANVDLFSKTKDMVLGTIKVFQCLDQTLTGMDKNFDCSEIYEFDMMRYYADISFAKSYFLPEDVRLFKFLFEFEVLPDVDVYEMLITGQEKAGDFLPRSLLVAVALESRMDGFVHFYLSCLKKIGQCIVKQDATGFANRRMLAYFDFLLQQLRRSGFYYSLDDFNMHL